MNVLAILDVETTSTEPAIGHVVEAAFALWSVEHRTVIRARSWLCAAPPEGVEATRHIHGIPPELVTARGVAFHEVAKQIHAIVLKEATWIGAWNADFDRAWMPHDVQNVVPWLDLCWDIDWPKATPDRKLLSVAHAHGVQVGALHRAPDDVLLVARLLERCAELGYGPQALIDQALRPRAVFAVADRRFDEERNRQAKDLGFRWHPESKTWRKKVALDSVDSLPFAVVRVDEERAA